MAGTLKAGHLRYFGFPKAEARRLVREHNATIAKRRSQATAQAKHARQLTMALAAGEPIAPDDVPAMMAQADPEIRALYLASQAPEESRTLALDADVGERAKIMLGADVDPELRAIFLAQITDRRPEPPSGPLGMDADRYALHVQAKELARTKIARDPRLSDANAYIMASLQIEDAKSLGPI